MNGFVNGSTFKLAIPAFYETLMKAHDYLAYIFLQRTVSQTNCRTGAALSTGLVNKNQHFSTSVLGIESSQVHYFCKTLPQMERVD